MFKSQEVDLSNYFKLPNPSLKSYFGKIRVGNDREYRTPFGGTDVPVISILNEWIPHLEGLKDSWPTLWDFESDLAKKVGPLSIQKPLSERLDDIASYYESISLDSTPISASALKAVLHEWAPLSGISPRGQQATVLKMKLSTNSGCPYFTKRRNVVTDSYIQDLSAVDSDIVMKLKGGNYKACAVLGWRGQEGGPTDDDVKQRVVWMFPFSINIEELRVYQVLIEQAQKFNLVPAWRGMEAVDEEITKLFDTKNPEDLVVCTDFTKFDQHFNPDLQLAAHDLLQGLLNASSVSKYWLKEVFPIKYNIPLAISMDDMYFGAHGMGSGSGGTNADETMVHRALQYEAAQRSGSRLNLHSQCLGDDGILTYPGITVDSVVASYTKHGLNMNVEKQYASSDDCVYLRRWHHKDYRIHGNCVGVYSTCRALGRLCEQERFYDPEVWGPKQVALRQLSIIENCKYHPLRIQFVEFCMRRDKYRLGIDIPGFLDNIEQIAQESIELMPDFLGYTKTLGTDVRNLGIGSWWIVNYLRNR